MLMFPLMMRSISPLSSTYSISTYYQYALEIASNIVESLRRETYFIIIIIKMVNKME